MTRRAEWHKAARKRLERIGEPDRTRLVAAVQRYASSERGDARPLVGKPGAYRLRVGGWRVFFRLEAEIMHVDAILERGGAYKQR